MTLKLKLIIITSTTLIVLIVLLRPYYAFVTQTLKVSPIKTLLSLDGLKSYNNRVNILFLGIAGADHEGPNLSDSIVVASYNLKDNQLTTISIPRDVWSEALRDKINSAYAYGEAKKKGAGFILAKAEVQTIIGQPIHYSAAINFDQFEELIDFLGGIEINVENSFVDKEFPISGKENDLCGDDPEYKCRYNTVSFTKGKIIIDGQTALNFVRSRHAIGSEGTDFAREKRQQKTIDAIKNKLITFAKKPEINQYKKLYELMDKLVKRDIDNQQVAIILKNIVFKKNFDQEKIVLSEDFFMNPKTNLYRYDGLWVLTPIDDDIKTVHKYIDCKLNQKTGCEQLKPKGQEDR
ncbi:MAG: cell envelope-related transcriptional attenuator [uncultured bacterium]|nr:MAG: cell envelope-related transcriptional attenuator [uncultured bacterium]